tara:strand:- start:1094 stop:2056 length:963 start_codon:yes stop_codon:yes gene_type:complete
MNLSSLRTLSVKLLKAHHLRYINFWREPDPETGVEVSLLKFRRDKDHSTKAFFDALNESGLQYKKISKDPDATEIVCELWPKGAKRRMTEMRNKAKKGVGYGKGESSSGPEGPSSSSNLPYIQVPNGEAMSNLLQATVDYLRTSGLDEEAEELLSVADAQPWGEFSRKVSRMLKSISIHSRPEIRQIREQLARSIVDCLGQDSSLLQGMRGVDLDKKISEILASNLDYILDTRGLADSILRLVSSTPADAPLRAASRTLEEVSKYDDSNEFESRVSSLASDIEHSIRTGEAILDTSSPLMRALSRGDAVSSYLILVGEQE